MEVINADKIRRARLSKGWTQGVVAALCKRSIQSVHMIETGKRDTIHEEFALRLARHLDVKFEDVFADTPASVVSGDSIPAHTRNTDG